MRMHFLAQGQTKTLCGARILECGSPNAPVFTDSIAGFERIKPTNRCIKCGKLLVRHVAARQRARERIARRKHQDALWEEFVRRVERAIELSENDAPEQPGELLEEVNDAESVEQTPQPSG